MEISIKSNSKKRLEIRTYGKQEETKAILDELKKTTRKWRRLLKEGYEINLVIRRNNSLLEE